MYRCFGFVCLGCTVLMGSGNDAVSGLFLVSAASQQLFHTRPDKSRFLSLTITDWLELILIQPNSDGGATKDGRRVSANDSGENKFLKKKKKITWPDFSSKITKIILMVARPTSTSWVANQFSTVLTWTPSELVILCSNQNLSTRCKHPKETAVWGTLFTLAHLLTWMRRAFWAILQSATRGQMDVVALPFDEVYFHQLCEQLTDVAPH